MTNGEMAEVLEEDEDVAKGWREGEVMGWQMQADGTMEAQMDGARCCRPRARPGR